MSSQPQNDSRWYTSERLWILCLALIATLPFIRILGVDYFHDDVEFIATNSGLKNIFGLWDVFQFHFQPTKPVTTFMIAFVHWLGDGTAIFHRLVTLVFHVGVTLLIYLNLRIFNQRLDKLFPAFICFAVALLFSIAPIHSETLTVVQFRGEVLATFFTLVACLFAQRLSQSNKQEWGILAIIATSIALASLSKEVFLLIAPLTTALFYYGAPATNTQNKFRFPGVIVGAALLCTIPISMGIEKDTVSQYTYVGNVGIGVTDSKSQFLRGTLAWSEGITKVVTGKNLTFLRLVDRAKYEFQHDYILSIAQCLFSVLLIVGLYLKKGWYRLCGGSLFVGMILYLAIPNRNVGSEHYWYFSTWALLGLICAFGWQLLERVPKFKSELFVVLLLVYTTYFSHKVQHRLNQTENKRTLYLHQVQAHPKLPSPWINAANMMMDLNPAFWKISKDYIDVAKKINPELRNIYTAEFVLWAKAQNYEQAEKSFRKIQSFNFPPKKLAKYFFDYGRLNRSALKCDAALESFKKAADLDETHLVYKNAYHTYQNALSNNRKKLCTPTNKTTTKG